MRTGRWLIGIGCLLLASCAGSQAGRELSRETLAQLVEYEDQLRGMSRILQAHYRATIIDMGSDINWASRTSERATRSILADDAVDALLADRYTEKAFREYIDTVVAETAASRVRFAELYAKQVTAEVEALNTAALEEKALQTTRVRLELLQREPSLNDRAAQIRPLIEAAVKAIQDGREPETTDGSDER
jgi:hypothetical protein